ncbi:hypothetical protein [Actinomadura kijaniata]|uniref:hypothetical protein n=1 Tax=Actinomadura kijaniata TaxID=46161 RepID=UPI000A6301BD|nr:hypothetical protein [Actinomadura kijaniata]
MRRVTAVLSALLLVVGGAGCTGEEKPGKNSPAAKKSSAPQRPDPTPAVRLATVNLPSEPGPLVDVVARQVRAAGTVRVELTTTGEQKSGGTEERTVAQLRTNASPPEAQLTIVDKDPEEPGTTEAVVTGGIIYTRVDGQEQRPGKPWVRLSRQDASNPELGPFAKLLTTMVDEVEKTLGELSSDTGLNVVRKGTFKGEPTSETVEGAATRRYQGTTKTADLKGGGKGVEAMTRLGLKEIAWTLWLDDKGLPRRFEAGLATPQGMKVRQSVTYRQWGDQVSITTPPADKVHVIGS